MAGFSHDRLGCVAVNSIDVEDNQVDEANSFDVESFIDEEFANLFDSDSDLDDPIFDEGGVESCSNSSNYLAQQLQKLKTSSVDTTRPNSQDVQRSGDEETRLPATKKEVILDSQNAEGNYCEKCRRLQSNPQHDLVSTDGWKDQLTDLKEKVVTDEQFVDILEEVGNIWKMLGPLLNIKQAKLKNIDHDYKHNTEKANCLLTTWKEQEGKNATVGSLENALLRIKRKDIADKFLGVIGVPCYEVMPIEFMEKPLHLNIRVGLTTEYAEPDTSVLLCEDATGRKYLVKEITDHKQDWNIEKIVDDENVLERMIRAVRNSRKTKEERRQESLKRVSAELSELRKRMKKVQLDRVEVEAENSKKAATPPSDSSPNLSKITLAEAKEMLKMCVIQSESAQTMYKVLIKLIGEVGPLDGNSRCLRQLSEFNQELREQERKLYPKLILLDSLKDNLDENQKAILERLQKWQQTQNKQVDGIEKLITSLLEQGKIAWKRKATNRKSEPIFNKFSGSLGMRRRVKTDSFENKKQYLSTLQDERNEELKKQISSPLCARQLQNM